MPTEEIRRLRAAGLSYKAIADKAGVSRQNIHAILNYYGTKEYNAKRRQKRLSRKGK